MKNVLKLAILILAVSSMIGCQKELAMDEIKSSLKVLETEYPYWGQVISGFSFTIELVVDRDGGYLGGLVYDINSEGGYKLNPIIYTIIVRNQNGRAIGTGVARGEKIFLNFFRDSTFLQKDVVNKLMVEVQTRSPQSKEELGKFTISLSDYNQEGYRNGVRAYEDKSMQRAITNIFTPKKKAVTNTLQVVATALFCWQYEQNGSMSLAHMMIGTYGFQLSYTHRGYLNKIHYTARNLGAAIVGKKATIYLNGMPLEITIGNNGVIDVGRRYFDINNQIDLRIDLNDQPLAPNPTDTWEFEISKIEYTQILEDRTEVPTVASGEVFNLPLKRIWQR
jgi:hypothetical protein